MIHFLSRKGIGLCALLLAVVTGIGNGQQLQASERGLRWRSGTIDKTRHFLITEFGAGFRVSSNEYPFRDAEHSFHLQWQLGLMRNYSRHWSFGVAAYLSADDDGSQLGPAIRARRWLSKRIACDLTGGSLLISLGGDHFELPGWVAQLSLTHSDWAAVALTYETLPYRIGVIDFSTSEIRIREDSKRSLFVAVKFGNFVGAGVGVVVPITIGAVLITLIED